MDKSKKIIFFDGLCNFCNRSVRFIISQDRENQFLFGSIQGNAGQACLKKFGIKDFPLKSLLLVEEEKLYTASSAVLRTGKFLGRGWQLGYILMLIPKFIRDSVYFFFARHRYQWFGKMDSCRTPVPGQEALFLD